MNVFRLDLADLDDLLGLDNARRMTVPVSIGGSSHYPFVVDTGAERTIVSHELARALRRAPAIDLPLDFVAQVAALARAQAVAGSVLEQRLLRGLILVFALSAAVVVAWFGRGWVAELAAVLPGGRDAVGWCGVAALCVLGNWGCAALRRWFERGSHAAA